MVHIVFFNENIAVCIKPKGVLSQGEVSDCLPAMLGEALREQGERNTEIYPVHRLDRETEGLMVYARNQTTAAELSRQIAKGEMKKEYLAVIEGVPEKEADTLTDLLFYDRAKGKSYAVKRPRKGVKEGILHYRLLATKNGRSLVHIQLQTGRTHQIRVQFSSRGMPLSGDRRYGGTANSDGMALCSCHLEFKHPTANRIEIFDTIPKTENNILWKLFENEIIKFNIK